MHSLYTAYEAEQRQIKDCVLRAHVWDIFLNCHIIKLDVWISDAITFSTFYCKQRGMTPFEGEMKVSWLSCTATFKKTLEKMNLPRSMQ